MEDANDRNIVQVLTNTTVIMRTPGYFESMRNYPFASATDQAEMDELFAIRARPDQMSLRVMLEWIQRWQSVLRRMGVTPNHHLTCAPVTNPTLFPAFTLPPSTVDELTVSFNNTHV